MMDIKEHGDSSKMNILLLSIGIGGINLSNAKPSHNRRSDERRVLDDLEGYLQQRRVRTLFVDVGVGDRKWGGTSGRVR